MFELANILQKKETYNSIIILDWNLPAHFYK